MTMWFLNNEFAYFSFEEMSFQNTKLYGPLKTKHIFVA